MRRLGAALRQQLADEVQTSKIGAYQFHELPACEEHEPHRQNVQRMTFLGVQVAPFAGVVTSAAQVFRLSKPG